MNALLIQFIKEEGSQKKHKVKRVDFGLAKQAILYRNNTNSTHQRSFHHGWFLCLTKIPITAIDHVGIEAEDFVGRFVRAFVLKDYQCFISLTDVYVN